MLAPLLPPEVMVLLPVLPVLRTDDRPVELRLVCHSLSQASAGVCRGRRMDTPSPGTPETPLHRPEAVCEPSICSACHGGWVWRAPRTGGEAALSTLHKDIQRYQYR